MYIARQPIFNDQLEVYGYELLYRSDTKATGFGDANATHATATVIGGLFESGMEDIVGDKRAFINFDASFLHSDLPEIIDSSRLIIEVLEDVKVNEALLKRIIALKEKGYKVALDDFIESYHEYPLVPYADIIKYDLMATPLESIRSEVVHALSQNKILLAEKIETKEVFETAKAMGFKLFQGYFFSRPSIVGKSSAKRFAKSNYLQLLTEVKKEEPSYQALAEIVERDAQMAHRLMRIINTRAGDDLIYSIKKALTYLGLKELERWVNILMIQDLSCSKPKALMELSLVRTKFSEQIAQHSVFKKVKYEASMLGLFSTIDAMLDESMAEAMEGVALPQSILDALVNESGDLYPVFELIKAYEAADFLRAEEIAKTIELDSDLLFDYYKKALHWAGEIIALMEVS